MHGYKQYLSNKKPKHSNSSFQNHQHQEHQKQQMNQQQQFAQPNEPEQINVRIPEQEIDTTMIGQTTYFDQHMFLLQMFDEEDDDDGDYIDIQQNTEEELGTQREVEQMWNDIVTNIQNGVKLDDIAYDVVTKCVEGATYNMKMYESILNMCKKNKMKDLMETIMSMFGRDVFSRCQLSKKQCDVINQMRKIELNLFCVNTSSSYSSSVNYEKKIKQVEELKLKTLFDEAKAISVSADSTRRGENEFYGIYLRIVTSSEITDVPFACFKWSASDSMGKGEQIARMILNLLKQNFVPLEKVVSMTTDGDSSMIGYLHGASHVFGELLKQELGNENHFFQSCWCGGHRMNKASEDLNEEKHFKLLVTIIETLCSGRNRYNFEMWKEENKMKEDGTKHYKLPELSTTRWLFIGIAMNL